MTDQDLFHKAETRLQDVYPSCPGWQENDFCEHMDSAKDHWDCFVQNGKDHDHLALATLHLLMALEVQG